MRKFGKVFQFRVELKDVTPPIWRRIQVPSTYSFWDLHVAIQDAMGWLDYHLHAFRIVNPATGTGETIGIPDEDFPDEIPTLPGWEVSIAEYFSPENSRADYEYDFGDDWMHEVALEATAPREGTGQYPRCLDGRRACPPEDCGGPRGYADLLRVLRDPTDDEHERMLTWVGGSFDPARFDPKKVKFEDPRKRWRVAFLEA